MIVDAGEAKLHERHALTIFTVKSKFLLNWISSAERRGMADLWKRNK